MQTLPAAIESEVMSVKTFGNCRSVELIDNDNDALDASGMQTTVKGRLENMMIWYDFGGIPLLPWDLQNDVRGVFIRALPPRGFICKEWPNNDKNKPCSKNEEVLADKPETWTEELKHDPYGHNLPVFKQFELHYLPRWHSDCMVFAYRYPDFVGFLFVLDMGTKAGKSEANFDTPSAGINVESIQLSPGCSRVRIFYKNYRGTTYSKDLSTKQSEAILDYDDYKPPHEYMLFTRAATCSGADCVSKTCTIQTWCYANYEYGYSPYYSTWTSPLPTSPGQTFEYNPSSYIADCVRSLKFSSGCTKVQLFDDDSSGACNPIIPMNQALNIQDTSTIYSNAASSTACTSSNSDDLTHDIVKYKVWPKYVDAALAARVEQEKKARQNEITPDKNPDLSGNLPAADSQPQSSGCWLCETPEGIDGVSFAVQTCWRGPKDPTQCTPEQKYLGYERVIDKDCRCVKFQEKNQVSKGKWEAAEAEVKNVAGAVPECEKTGDCPKEVPSKTLAQQKEEVAALKKGDTQWKESDFTNHGTLSGLPSL
jgi:hypothetical protein